jgi:hypothetical protein
MRETAGYSRFFDALSYCLELFTASDRKPDVATVEKMRIALG